MHSERCSLFQEDEKTLRPQAFIEHYSELFNRHPVVDESVLDVIKQHDPIMALDEVPSRGEIKASVSQMNNIKAPGMDGIKAEILKNGGEKMIDLLEQVIQSLWESEVPQDWRDAILVSLYKKGLKSDCSNFRGISLLSIVGKLFSRIILNRLVRTIVNGIQPESQRSFRASRDTVDMIFSARQLHPVDGNEKLSLMGWSHCAYGEMWKGKRSALKPKKRFKDTIKYYLKQSGLSVDQ